MPNWCCHHPECRCELRNGFVFQCSKLQLSRWYESHFLRKTSFNNFWFSSTYGSNCGMLPMKLSIHNSELLRKLLSHTLGILWARKCFVFKPYYGNLFVCFWLVVWKCSMDKEFKTCYQLGLCYLVEVSERFPKG